MKIVSVKYVQGVAYKILGEVRDGDSLSDREMAILRAGFHKLVDRLYATSDESPKVLEFLKELAVITSGLTKREPDDGDSPVETELSNDELDTDYQLWSNM
jgi:hypothetical protein